MSERIEQKKNRKIDKTYMSIKDFSRMVDDRVGPRVRSERSYELEKMDVKIKDLKNMSKEDVEELRIIHKDNILYKIYFSWFWPHLPKVIALICSLVLFVYWFGVASLIAFLPITLLMVMMIFFIRLTRGY